MTSECMLRIPISQNIQFIHSLLKEHIIIYDPPYSIVNILSQYMSPIGREIKVGETGKPTSIWLWHKLGS